MDKTLEDSEGMDKTLEGSEGLWATYGEIVVGSEGMDKTLEGPEGQGILMRLMTNEIQRG